jgi:Cu+-exporting ATPase
MGLATPTAIIVAVGRGASLGILIKDVQALEILNKVKIIVFDKTGTLTKGNFGVVGEVDDEVLKLAASIEQYSEHPIAKAIVTKAKNLKLKIEKATNFRAIEGMGVEGFIDGVKVEVKRPGVSVYKNGELIGLITVEDGIKSGAKEVISKLSSKGITTWMVTGDNKTKAAKIAEEAGIKNILSEVMPADKANKIKELGIGSQVAFVGDGINDAPALATASVGIAMGTGTDIAIESAGITLMNKDFRSILSIFNLSKVTMDIIKQNLFWAFGYNIILIPVAAFGLLNPMIAAGAMAVSSLSVVGNSLRLKTVKI